MVANMKFDEEPNHGKLVLLFDSILGPNPTVRPINTDGVEKPFVSSVPYRLVRREGESDVEEDEDDQPKKKIQLGMPATQWITTFTTLGGQMKQRYHYDAVDSRLTEHVEKGNEDSLYISSVASCTNLWALVMDTRTRFTAQVHELSHVFAVLECILLVSRGEFSGFSMLDKESLIEAGSGKREVERVKRPYEGDKAKHCDPRQYHYSGTAYLDFWKESSRRGDACKFMHRVFELTTGRRSGGGYDGSPRARAAACYDGAFGYESLSYDVASVGHDPSHLSRYSSSANSGAGYVTSQNSSPRSTVVKYKQYAVLLSPPLSPSKSPPPSPGAGSIGIGCREQVQLELAAKSRFNWNQLPRAGPVGIGCQEQVQLESAAESKSSRNGLPRSRSSWNWLPRAGSIGIGYQEQIQLESAANSKFSWNWLPRAGSIGIGCQEQLELAAKSRFNWNRLPRAGLVGIICQEQVQLESGAESRFCRNWLLRAGSIGIGCQEQVQLELAAKSRFNWNRLPRAGPVGIGFHEQVQLESAAKSRSSWNWLQRAGSIGIGCQQLNACLPIRIAWPAIGIGRLFLLPLLLSRAWHEVTLGGWQA
uniref:Uncharacterized protein n=1 Tax=Physcomitrium patens TaxID=3218 RepID=A0A7I4BP73_PHYPA